MKKLFWIDMEMTGLDIEKEVVIEVAAIITDLDLKPLQSFEAVVKQPNSYLEAMDTWNREHHGASGLLGKIPHGEEPEDVENKLIDLVHRHFDTGDREGRPVIAGNSISQDRLFIDKYFKRFAALLHYRMMDVTAWKVMMAHKYGRSYKKKNAHRALEDIRESIEEMKYYLSFVKEK